MGFGRVMWIEFCDWCCVENRGCDRALALTGQSAQSGLLGASDELRSLRALRLLRQTESLPTFNSQKLRFVRLVCLSAPKSPW